MVAALGLVLRAHAADHAVLTTDALALVLLLGHNSAVALVLAHGFLACELSLGAL